MSLVRCTVFLVCCGVFPQVAACSSDSGSGATPGDDSGVDAGSDGADVDGASDASTLLQETEPNNGATVDEYDDLALGAELGGSLQEPGDIDVFKIATEPGKVYRATLLMPAGSSLEGHLTVMDDGRNGKAPGDDFVKMAIAETTSSTDAVFLAMGQGGYFVAVRDSRNVEGGYVGGPGFDYQLSVVEIPTTQVEKSALSFPAQQSGALDAPGGLHLYPFDGTAGSDVVFDVKATAEADFRLLVFSKTQGDWIARNDDRASGDKNPLIDAPLTASGAMWLVVENVDPVAASLGYELQASMP